MVNIPIIRMMNRMNLLLRAVVSNSKKCFFLIKYSGFKEFILKCGEKIKTNPINNTKDYKLWIDRNEPKMYELNKQRKIRFQYQPKISIIVPIYNTPRVMLVEMLESVKNQTYNNWELCIVDGGSRRPYIKKIVTEYMQKDNRLKFKFLSTNKGIAGNSNEAISLATGDFIALLDHDDTLAPFALFEVVKTINASPEVDCIYSDEDKITENSEKRFNPFFKPDYAPDTLRSYNYICHFLVLKRGIGKLLGWFREGFDGAQDYDLVLRVSEVTNNFVHIPKVLYHWRAHCNSTAMEMNNKVFAEKAGEKCLYEHLQRIGLRGSVRSVKNRGYYKIEYEIATTPLISIIILNKDLSEILSKCVASILMKTSYLNYEIIIVENMSSEQKTFELYRKLKECKNIRIIEYNIEFNFSKLNNFAVGKAKGDVVVFLNNDTEVISPDWLDRMLEHVLRNEVGGVGAKLYYQDNTIQHAGVIIGIGGIAGHTHKHFSRQHSCYLNRLEIVQNLSAVTAACFMVKKEIFEQVGGFSEDLGVAFNDVDLCLKIRSKGYLIVWTPYAELYHYESKTRGPEDTECKVNRFNSEIIIFKKRWGLILKEGDPYYNLNLTLDKADLSFNI